MPISHLPAPRYRLLPAALDSLGGAILNDARASLALAVALVASIALADYATGYETRLAVLYLLPVLLASWAAGWIAGALIATLATLSWMVIFRSSHPYSHDLYYYWEAAVLLGTLTVFALILSRLRQALEHADERFVTVLEGLDAAVYVNELDSGRILYTNRRFRDFFGAGAASENARDLEKSFGAPPAGLFTRAAAAQGEASALKGEFHHQASGRWYLVHSRPINWIDGHQVSLKVVADITESRQAEQASRQQMEKLQLSSKLITIGEMASALAHELNQPLTAIASYNQGCMRLLRSGRPDTAELLDVMEKCSAQAVRAGKIINRMREFLRKREPMRSQHQINAIINEALQMIAMEAERNSVEIAQELAPEPAAVLADAIMIEQVLLNLMRNAIEAMQQTRCESRRLTVSSAHAGNAMLQVSVRDSGPGIAAEVAANLYTPFFSTKAGGMGIGLNISRSIIEFHGGKLWHEAGSDGGCVFHFTLPEQSA